MIGNKIGRLGEEVARRYLQSIGHKILDCNWVARGTGEIDIVSSKSGVVHIVEVKCVTRENKNLTNAYQNPAENVTNEKMRNLRRTTEVYLNAHRNISRVTFSVISVTLLTSEKKAYCELIEDIPLS